MYLLASSVSRHGADTFKPSLRLCLCLNQLQFKKTQIQIQIRYFLSFIAIFALLFLCDYYKCTPVIICISLATTQNHHHMVPVQGYIKKSMIYRFPFSTFSNLIASLYIRYINNFETSVEHIPKCDDRDYIEGYIYITHFSQILLFSNHMDSTFTCTIKPPNI